MKNKKSILTVAEFNERVKSGTISINQVNMYRFWHDDAFQDIPARSVSEAKTLLNNYGQRIASLDNISKIELNDFGTQQYRAFLESSELFSFDKNTGEYSDEAAFRKMYEENKRKRGITKSDGEFWLFKGREYNNVGIPKEVYLKAREKTERELGIYKESRFKTPRGVDTV